MTLVNLEDVSLAFGLQPLLDHIQFQISKGERVCLIGRNGAGKSSFLRIIEGVQLPDSGLVWRMPHLRIARLEQELPFDLNMTVYDYVATALAEVGQLLSEYDHVTHQLAHEATPQLMDRLQSLQQQIDAKDGWLLNQQIETILTKLDLPKEQPLSALSGGWLRRAALAKALVTAPDLLLLDEPTNHLDIEAIQWLEEQLLSLGCGVLFITHDRALLQRLATRIIELDRGQLTSWPGDYANFLRRKEELLHAEEKQNADFDKKLAQEERWIRQGIKARRTRNEGRVRALKAMRAERASRREVQGKADFNVNTADKSGKLVIEAQHVSHQFAERTIIKDFSIRILRGDHIGLIGPNGVGKTTLLSILLGQLAPTHGTVTLGTKLEIAYFDQHRQALDREKSVKENVVSGSDTITVNGQSQHIISYLSQFLFTAERTMTPVKALSGGECNRLLLARLFAKPANMLVLDEPTNDLDIETLELLEELLSQYQGTLLIVSHDRAFLNNVVTSTLVFEGDGRITEYVGGYDDYLAQRQLRQTTANVTKDKVTRDVQRQPKKLSYKDQKELDDLPLKIEKLEKEQQNLQSQMAAADFYKQTPEAIAHAMDQLKQLEQAIETAYKRWEDLQILVDKLQNDG